MRKNKYLTMETNEIIYQHVYQNTVDGVLLFYDNTDRIIFFTILSVLSERYGVRIIAISLMPDHYHLLLEASGRYPIVNFIRTLDSVYAKAFNRTINRKGRIFNKEFGCAPKRTPKEIISTINYILNNPLVKLLDDRVESSRWNYLPYSLNKHPFSSPLRLDCASKSLRTAIKGVETINRNGKWMTYRIVDNMLSKLPEQEKQQLADYIISCYYNIDYEASASFYGSMRKMIDAANFNSGSEYSLKEVVEVKDDRTYETMQECLRMHRSEVKKILCLDYEHKLYYAKLLMGNVSPSARQVEKFLHLPDGTLYTKTNRLIRVSNHYRHLPLPPAPVGLQPDR